MIAPSRRILVAVVSNTIHHGKISRLFSKWREGVLACFVRTPDPMRLNTSSKYSKIIPVSVEQAVHVLVACSECDGIEYFRDLPYDSLISLHHSLGRQIRNEFFFSCDGNDSLLADCTAIFDPSINRTTMIDIDEASMVIIQQLWHYIQQIPRFVPDAQLESIHTAASLLAQRLMPHLMPHLPA